MQDLITFVNLGVAFCFGCLIGLEREWRKRIAGLRTNALVACGAALFVTIGQELGVSLGEQIRIAAQIVPGVSFLGAGVILRDGINIRGLNTAATLWCAAAVGALSGFGLWREAGMGTVLVLIANVGLRPFAVVVNNKATARHAKRGHCLLNIKPDTHNHNADTLMISTHR